MGRFFRNAPKPNPDRMLIKGTVCGVRVEEIQEPLMREIRYLDKLVDELTKGKPMHVILRNSEEKNLSVSGCDRAGSRQRAERMCAFRMISEKNLVKEE